MAKRISCTDTAKLIRQALKESFAGIKFSVKSSSASMSQSIRVTWIDGPNEPQVEAVVKRFSGSYFDGMQDLKGTKYHMIDGVQVTFDADFIFCDRAYSDAAITKAVARVFRNFSGNFKGASIAMPTPEQYRAGALYAIQIPHLGAHHQHDLQYFVRAALSKNSDRMGASVSPTAARIFQTHTDGNGQSSFDAIKSTL